MKKKTIKLMKITGLKLKVFNLIVDIYRKKLNFFLQKSLIFSIIAIVVFIKIIQALQCEKVKKTLFYLVFGTIYALTYNRIVIKPRLTSTKLYFNVARGVQILKFKILAFLNCKFLRREVWTARLIKKLSHTLLNVQIIRMLFI